MGVSEPAAISDRPNPCRFETSTTPRKPPGLNPAAENPYSNHQKENFPDPMPRIPAHGDLNRHE